MNIKHNVPILIFYIYLAIEIINGEAILTCVNKHALSMAFYSICYTCIFSKMAESVKF